MPVNVTTKRIDVAGNPIVDEYADANAIDVSNELLWVNIRSVRTVAIYAPGNWASAEVLDTKA